MGEGLSHYWSSSPEMEESISTEAGLSGYFNESTSTIIDLANLHASPSRCLPEIGTDCPVAKFARPRLRKRVWSKHFGGQGHHILHNRLSLAAEKMGIIHAFLVNYFAAYSATQDI
jgi:hypothetical protein